MQEQCIEIWTIAKKYGQKVFTGSSAHHAEDFPGFCAYQFLNYSSIRNDWLEAANKKQYRLCWLRRQRCAYLRKYVFGYSKDKDHPIKTAKHVRLVNVINMFDERNSVSIGNFEIAFDEAQKRWKPEPVTVKESQGRVKSGLAASMWEQISAKRKRPSALDIQYMKPPTMADMLESISKRRTG